jgi:indole-3-glycerol phosphate synthase
MATILDEILARTAADLAARPRDHAALERACAAAAPAPDALAALSAPGIRIIAEVKRRSPSAGALAPDVDAPALAERYARAGAAAISVLTEPHWFGGCLADLAAVTGRVVVPCLRKDFVLDAVQLLEARAHGAAMVLLIAAALGDGPLRSLRERAEALGMQALVEAHTADEVRRANACGARLIGVNSRDLKTFTIDLAVAERLRPLIGPGAIAIAESGVRDRGDVDRLVAAGYSAFLVGSSLVAAADAEEALAVLLGDDDSDARPRRPQGVR